MIFEFGFMLHAEILSICGGYFWFVSGVVFDLGLEKGSIERRTKEEKEEQEKEEQERNSSV